MSPKSFAAIPAVLLALCAVPAAALDLSVGGSAGGNASGSTGDSGFSAGFDASASASATADHGSDDDDADGSASVAAGGSASAGVSGSLGVDDEDPLLDVLLLIRGSNWTKASFSGIGDVEGTTYDIDAWINSENSAAFEQTLAAKADDIANLQSSIAANADFNAWLDAENTDTSAVVAVGVAADGSLAVFTHG
ncbi:MAG: hypothetical protein ACYCZU_11520 [Devosia sp.]